MYNVASDSVCLKKNQQVNMLRVGEYIIAILLPKETQVSRNTTPFVERCLQ